MNSPKPIKHKKPGRKSPKSGKGVPFNQWMWGVLYNNSVFNTLISESQIQDLIKSHFPTTHGMYSPEYMNKFVSTQRHRFNHGTLWSGAIPQKPKYLSFPVNGIPSEKGNDYHEPLRLTSAYGKILTIEQIVSAYDKHELSLTTEEKEGYKAFQSGHRSLSELQILLSGIS